MKTKFTKGKAMGKTPSCKNFRLMADEYIEGELTAAEMSEFEAHIAECEECRKEFEELRALKEAIRSAEEEMPEGLHSRIMESIKAEPKEKPRRKVAFFRGAAISVACVMLCLSATLAITLIPMWRSGTGGEGVPKDPDYAITEECNTEMKSESALSKPTDVNVEAEQTSASVEDPAPEFAPSDTVSIPETAKPETMVVAETIVPETMAATGISTSPETDVEMQAPAEEVTESTLKDGAETQITYQDAAPNSESSSAPGGNEITLALLIVSGLLAVASFVAFLISLSSVRTSSAKKDPEPKE